MSKTKVVILGAGYAGLMSLKVLQRAHKEVEITLIDRNDYHYEATDLHEVASGSLPAEKISYKIADVVKNDCTVFMQGTIEKIDKASKTVYLADGKTVSYDYLIVALGFVSETFGIPGAQEYALQLVDIKTSEEVYAHILEKLNDYKKTKNPDDLKFVVCGAGFTGIELLGSMCENRKKYAELAGVAPEEIKLYCVEAITKLLPMFPEKLGDYGIGHLKDWGVEFLTGKPIKEIKEGIVVYENNAETHETAELTAGTIVWTTGVSGSPVIANSGYEARRNRVSVTPELTDPEDSHVFIIGDVSAVMDQESGRPYAATAQISLKMGVAAAENVLAQINGQAMKPFAFKSLGSVASIGNTDAFGLVGKSSVKGYPASFVKKAIMNKSLYATGGLKEVMSKGRFDLYH
ncbi:MAG: NAD(P)/FAD-dependent oxidoreductase [Lactobacillales bacterium]|nr:NAD(P)/FAD-dependent oxidoreductase [Lactobacillales bacterium]